VLVLVVVALFELELKLRVVGTEGLETESTERCAGGGGAGCPGASVSNVLSESEKPIPEGLSSSAAALLNLGGSVRTARCGDVVSNSGRRKSTGFVPGTKPACLGDTRPSAIVVGGIVGESDDDDDDGTAASIISDSERERPSATGASSSSRR